MLCTDFKQGRGRLLRPSGDAVPNKPLTQPKNIRKTEKRLLDEPMPSSSNDISSSNNIISSSNSKSSSSSMLAPAPTPHTLRRSCLVGCFWFRCSQRIFQSSYDAHHLTFPWQCHGAAMSHHDTAMGLHASALAPPWHCRLLRRCHDGAMAMP